jgi:hypothetical protein
MKSLSKPLFSFTILAAIVLSSCNSKKSDYQISNGIYWWSGSMVSYNSNFDEYLPWLKNNRISKIYFKMYDVDWNKGQGIFPADGLHEAPENKAIRLYHEFVPCIFITNAVFEHGTNVEIEELSKRLADKIDNSFIEYQIDCDWSISTKDKYFLLLTLLKQKRPKHLQSVTIRLFQYKYPEKTGIPPSDRGALMLYNFSSPKKYTQQNSIFDYDEALKYVSDKKYALPLDFILPSFGWSAVYNEQRFIGLLRNFDEQKALDFCIKNGPHIYASKLDTVIEDFYIRKGDEIKVENVDEKMLLNANKLIDKFKNTNQYTTSVFSLTNKTQQLLNHDIAKKIYAHSE